MFISSLSSFICIGNHGKEIQGGRWECELNLIVLYAYIHCHFFTPTNYTIPNIYFSWFHFEEDVILDSWYIHASCCLLFLCFCFREKYIIWAPKDVTCHVIVCVCVFFFFFFCLQKFPALQIDPQRYELVSKFITLVEWTC